MDQIYPKKLNGDSGIYKHLDNRCKNSLYLKESTEFELLNIVKIYKNEKSENCNGISMNTIKKS